MRILLSLAGLALLSAIGMSATIYVPDNFATIQGAIDASANGDVIIVRAGTYVENIDFVGMAITVKSESGTAATVIDGNQSGSVVVFQNGEGADSVLDGFTLTNGKGTPPSTHTHGGGIYCNSSSPTISNNVISDNSAYYGGGISCGFSTAVIINNTIAGNEAVEYFGGGIYCYDSSPEIMGNAIMANEADWGGGISCDKSSAVIVGNLLSDNTATYEGGGFGGWHSDDVLVNNTVTRNMAESGGGISCAVGSTAIVVNCTVINNGASSRGGGIDCFWDSSTDVVNTIVWDNQAPIGSEIGVDGRTIHPAHFSISYSDVKGGLSSVYVDSDCTLNWGFGMLDDDPLFIDPANSDFHITWYSPCRNAGDNSVVTEPFDFENDPRIIGTTVDIGADEFYYHLYHTGNPTPGNTIDLKVIGYPQAPITLAWGQTILDPPLNTQHGNLYIWPFVWSGFIGNVQSNGVLSMPVTIPSIWQPGDHAPLQALVGPWGDSWTKLTNLMDVVVE